MWHFSSYLYVPLHIALGKGLLWHGAVAGQSFCIFPQIMRFNGHRIQVELSSASAKRVRRKREREREVERESEERDREREKKKRERNESGRVMRLPSGPDLRLHCQIAHFLKPN